MCNFQKLAFSEDGYIVRCIECGHYQLGFGTTMLTLSNADFCALHEMVAIHLDNISNENGCLTEETKGIFIATPSPSCCLVLSKKGLQSLYDILESADSEIKTLSLLELFK